jgi:hypothetical protein
MALNPRLNERNPSINNYKYEPRMTFSTIFSEVFSHFFAVIKEYLTQYKMLTPRSGSNIRSHFPEERMAKCDSHKVTYHIVHVDCQAVVAMGWLAA